MTDAISKLPPLREVIAAHNLAAQKKLGQHFLLDLNLTEKIARAAGPMTDGTVIEIGPGPGGLTRALLLQGARHVIAIEKDSRCIAALADLKSAADGRLEILEADARHLDVNNLGYGPRKIVANLPYNVGTPLLIDWISKATFVESMTLMFQREVADRIVAGPGDPSYGRLSVLANWRCQTRKLLNLPARAFTPPPNVDSAVVSLKPYKTPPFAADQAILERITAAAFGQRRKMLRGALKTLPIDPLELLEAADIDPTKRAENIDTAGFAALACAFSALTAPGEAP